MKAVKRYLKDNLGILIALTAMILFLCVWPATAKTFPTKTNLFNLLRQSSTNLMLACGMTMVIILGGELNHVLEKNSEHHLVDKGE